MGAEERAKLPSAPVHLVSARWSDTQPPKKPSQPPGCGSRHLRLLTLPVRAVTGSGTSSAWPPGAGRYELYQACNGTETPGAQPPRQKITVAHGKGGAQ
jgi:hypothetical protein